MFDEPVHVGLDKRPCGSPDSCKSREEGKHVNIDRVDSIEDVLGPTTLLVSICEFANSDRDANTREFGFQRLDLWCELRVRQYVIEQRLRTKLDNSGDESSLWVIKERVNKRVTASYPLIASVESELRAVKWSQWQLPAQFENVSPRSGREPQDQCPTQRPRYRHWEATSQLKNKKKLGLQY